MLKTHNPPTIAPPAGAYNHVVEVPPGAHLVLQTGNAGGLQITVGGKQIPPLGQAGDVRDNILLDADSLLRTAR